MRRISESVDCPSRQNYVQRVHVVSRTRTLFVSIRNRVNDRLRAGLLQIKRSYKLSLKADRITQKSRQLSIIAIHNWYKRTARLILKETMIELKLQLHHSRLAESKALILNDVIQGYQNGCLLMGFERIWSASHIQIKYQCKLLVLLLNKTFSKSLAPAFNRIESQSGSLINQSDVHTVTISRQASRSVMSHRFQSPFERNSNVNASRFQFNKAVPGKFSATNKITNISMDNVIRTYQFHKNSERRLVNAIDFAQFFKEVFDRAVGVMIQWLRSVVSKISDSELLQCCDKFGDELIRLQEWLKERYNEDISILRLFTSIHQLKQSLFQPKRQYQQIRENFFRVVGAIDGSNLDIKNQLKKIRLIGVDLISLYEGFRTLQDYNWLQFCGQVNKLEDKLLKKFKEMNLISVDDRPVHIKTATLRGSQRASEQNQKPQRRRLKDMIAALRD